ncbi:MAG: alpha/beta hydrolase [Saprospiraceae bacterium]|nr:alpha/beta hydrolase [Saprospiraceae bacterium]
MQFPKWLIITARIFLVLIAGTLMSGIVYEQASRYSARSNYQPEGELMDINGRQLHVVRKGQGGPTVIFESDLGMSHIVWDSIQMKVASETTTLSYDRYGLLFSETNRNALTAEHFSTQLEAVLKSGNYPKPYLIVGHGLAACFLRPFVQKYPNDIAGIILVDPEHPQYERRMSPSLKTELEDQQRSRRATEFLSGFGFMRTILANQPYFDQLDADHPLNQFHRDNFFRNLPGMFHELNTQKDIRAIAEASSDFGNIPLSIITGTAIHRVTAIEDEQLQKEAYQLWRDLQEEQLALSDESRLILAPESGHLIQVEQPEIVLNTILEHLKFLPASKDTTAAVAPPY